MANTPRLPKPENGPIAKCLTFSVMLAVFLAVAIWPGSARAGGTMAKDQAIDLAVQALAVSGLVPIPQNELQILRPLISCMTDGNKSPGDCAKTAVYERVLGSSLGQAAPIVECIVGGSPVAACAQNAALSQLPPEVRSALTCANQVQQCTQDAVLSQLPPDAQRVIQCVNQGGSEVDCAASNATGPAKKAFEDIKKLTDPKTGSKIVQIFKAIQDEDWLTLAELVGEQAAQMVTCAVLQGLLGPGPHQGILCDAAGKLIAKRVDAVQTLIEQAMAHDVGGMLGTLAKAELIDRQCAFLEALGGQEPQIAAIVEVVCGGAAKLIEAAASDSRFVGVFTGIATGNPILGLAAFGLMELLGGSKKECPDPATFYRTNFMACQHRAVYLGQTDAAALKALADKKQHDCYLAFHECLDKKTNPFCDGLRDKFLADANALITAYSQLADGHMRGLRSDLENDRSRVCGVTQTELMNTQSGINYLAGCENMLNQVRPLQNLPDAQCNSTAPTLGGGYSRFSGDPTAAQMACQKSSQTTLKQIVGQVCAGAGVCFPIIKCEDGSYFSGSAGQCLQSGPK